MLFDLRYVGVLLNFDNVSHGEGMMSYMTPCIMYHMYDVIFSPLSVSRFFKKNTRGNASRLVKIKATTLQWFYIIFVALFCGTPSTIH